MSNLLQNESSSTSKSESTLTDVEISAMCNQFMLVTNTDSVLAMDMLNLNQWNLERAVSVYFESIENKSNPSNKEINTSASMDVQHKTLSVLIFIRLQ